MSGLARLHLAALALTVAFLLTTTAAFGGIERVTNTPYDEHQVRVSGDYLVYVALTGTGSWFDNEEVYVHKLSTGVPTRLTDDGVRQYEPSISGDRVVWTDYRQVAVGWDYDVFGYDILSTLLGPVSAAGGAQYQPSVSGDRAVWVDNRDDISQYVIYTKEPGTGVEHAVSPNPGGQWQPEIDGERVVWSDQRSDDGDIYLYDFGTATQTPICVASGMQWAPDIDGDIVVWTDDRSGTQTIWFYNLSTSETGPLCPQAAVQYDARVSGTKVVWHASGGVFLYDFAAPGLRALTHGPGWSGYPDIDGDTIVWQNDADGNWDIYRFVNLAPELSPIGNKSVDEGQLLTFTVSATDPEDDSLIFSASNLPDGALFDPDTMTFTWTPTFSQTGNYPSVRFEVSDGELTDFEEITISVGNVNRPPVLDPIGDKTVEEEATLSFTLSGSDPDDDPLTFSASALPAGASFDSLTMQFTWTPTQAQVGSHPGVSFMVTDGDLSDSEIITITVTERLPVEVGIDIKPGSERNPVNPKSQGVLPVAVFSSDSFDATDIDPSTVLLSGAPVAQNPDDGKWMIEEKDENGDGLMDVRVHFDTEEIDVELLVDEEYAILTGITFGNIEFVGSDNVTIVPKDLPNDHWALEEIAECLEGEIVQGYPDGTYLPDVKVSRAQMAAFVSRAHAGGDDAVPEGPEEASFPDVPTDHWAYDYVEYATASSIVTGYGDGSYQPSWIVNRGQMAVFIARAEDWVSLDEDLATAPQLFLDVPAGYWAGKAIEACVSHGVVQGYADGLYRPTAEVTRDQMAVYIARAWELSM